MNTQIEFGPDKVNEPVMTILRYLHWITGNEKQAQAKTDFFRLQRFYVVILNLVMEVNKFG